MWLLLKVNGLENQIFRKAGSSSQKTKTENHAKNGWVIISNNWLL
jgi:hypothetical protein